MTQPIWAGEDTDGALAVPVGRGELWLYTHRSPARETGNEDAALVWQRDEAIVLAVADGLGGLPASAAAARAALEALNRTLDTSTPGEAMRGTILDGFEAANQAVRDLGVGAGTTLVLVEIVDGWLRSYHVGDSAALVVGQRGRCKLETISHSPVGYGVAAGLIEPDDAVVHEDRHYLSNHLGTAEMRIDVGSPLRLATRDTVLLASDGLLDNLLPREIMDAIRTGPLVKVAERLVHWTRERMVADEKPDVPGKPDDTTFLLFRDPSGGRAS